MKKTLIALAAALPCAGAFADCGGALTFVSNTTSFACTAPASPINNVYTFALASTSYLTSSTVTTVQQGMADIDFSSIYFDNVLAPATHFNFTMTSPDPNETWAINNLVLGPGSYELHLLGTQSSASTPGSYGGNITVTPVPEPETYAMMLAGLGAMGFIARRRRKA